VPSAACWRRPRDSPPSAGKKHRKKADADYAQAVTDGNSESGVDGGDDTPIPPVTTGGAETDTGSVGS
jgi:hypothetical protein